LDRLLPSLLILLLLPLLVHFLRIRLLPFLQQGLPLYLISFFLLFLDLVLLLDGQYFTVLFEPLFKVLFV
jgi:hypothetical protein